jgi:diacylglycerol kinase (ATP)
VMVDGHRHGATWAVIANARHYGGPFVLAPRTGIRERGLQAILFKTRNRAILLGQLMSLVAGRLGPDATRGGDVEMLPCSRVSVTAHHAVPIQIDGDVFGTTPVEVDAGTGELSLIIPGPSNGAGNSKH